MHGDVHVMMEAALDDPIGSLNLEHPGVFKFVKYMARKQIDHFARPFAVALDPSAESSCHPAKRAAGKPT